MPREGETRDCIHEGCKGTQTFSKHSKPPGWSSGVGGEDGQIHYAREAQPGWQCDVGLDHWDAPEDTAP